MAVSFNTIEITLKGLCVGQETRNVFHYDPGVDVDNTLLGQFVADFEDKFFGLVDVGLRQEFFAAAMTYTGITARTLQDPAPIFEVEFAEPYTGGTAGEIMPPFVAIAYKSARTIGTIRAGQKRFAGVVESAVNGGIIHSAFDADLDGLGTLLGETITTGLFDAAPVIVKRIFVPATETVKAHYRLPETKAETDVAEASSWTYNPNVTSQGTRRVGRGI